jgi:hypothetical protein
MDEERSFEAQLGPLGGFELRPTRLFLWRGEAREETARIVSLGFAPAKTVLESEGRGLEAGPLRVHARGNPLMTIGLAGVYATRRAVRRVTGP